MPCVTILVYLGNYLVYLYLFNLSTYKSSSPCGTYSERRDVILWRLISMREIRLTCRDARFVVVLSRVRRIFPERDKVHSPMASDFRSGALGDWWEEIAPCKGQKSYVSSRAFFTFAPNRAHHAGDAYPGCRLTPFALPCAMDSLGFQPVTNYSLLTDAAPQGISVNSCSFVVLNKTNFRGHPLRTAPVFPCK